jgi:uncharacterized protein (DUF736 family)
MGLKRIGALWNKEDKNNQPYFSGTLDLGVLGEAQIMIFPNKRKEEDNHPDAIISLVVNDDDDQK